MLLSKEKKYLEKPVSGADNYLSHIKCDLKLPPNVIICPVSMLTKIVANNYKNKMYRLDSDIYVLEGHNCAYVTNFGIGAPAFASVMEPLIALGCNNFMLIGIAGALQADIETASIIVCDRALRDEGVSSSYIAPGDFSYPSTTLTDKVKGVIASKNMSCKTGTTWTTDVLFRETAPEILAYQKEGVLTVEMEAAAAFAIAEHYKVNCAALFTISDTLANLKWEPAFGHKSIDQTMLDLLKISIEALNK